MASMMSAHLSKDFFDLVKAIGESKSKQQEDRIISDEVQTLKKKMPEAKISRKKMKEFLVRLIYVEICVEINQCVGCNDDAAVLAPSSGEEPASPRHRAGVASMAWRMTRRFSTNAP